MTMQLPQLSGGLTLERIRLWQQRRRVIVTLRSSCGEVVENGRFCSMALTSTLVSLEQLCSDRASMLLCDTIIKAN